MKSETLNNLQAMRDSIDQLRAKMLQEAKDSFKTVAKELFDFYPKLESFSWTQYTPYFNDGDSCEFSANIDYPEINGEEAVSEWGLEYAKRNNKNEEELKDLEFLKQMGDKVIEFLSIIGQDTLKEMFGDHAKIIVTKDGIQVEEYNHE